MSDQLDSIDVGDIPMPTTAVQTSVEDAFSYKTAFGFSFVGVGHGGSRIAEEAYNLGYRRVCAINTTDKDLVHIKIPQASKLVIKSANTASHEGAGKDPNIASAAVVNKSEEVYDLLKRCFGERYDWTFVCLGAGGGTGAGASAKVVEIAGRLMTDLKLERRVGAIVALPKNDEGHRVAQNTIDTLAKLEKLGLSPIIVIDNERIKSIYPKIAVGQFWSVANRGICALLHLFNRISAQASKYTAFDPADFATILDSGVVVFGATAIPSYESQADISKAIRMQLQTNILAAVDTADLAKGKRAGCIFVGGESILDSIPQEYLDHGFEMLSRILAPGSTIHRGIYPGSQNDLRTYTMIGGLDMPRSRLQELAKLSGSITKQE